MNNLRSHLIVPEQILLIVLFAAGSALSLVPPVAGQTVTGSGTAGDIPKFTGANAIGNSIIIENANKIGIGTATPTSELTVQGSASNPIIFGKNSGTGPGIRGESVGGFGIIGKSARTGVQGISTGSVGNAVWGHSRSHSYSRDIPG